MDDLISRQAAIDALNKKKIYRPLDSDRYVISDCINAIVHLPSAERRGRWVAHDGEYEYALQNIADMFDPPCCYSYNSQDGADFMLEHAEGFCEECDYHTYAECWRKYFEVLRQMEATK